jgi:phosphoribosyl 1,2-cyclic phosphate phosphodiesterase
MKITFLGTGTSQGVPIMGCKCRVCDSVNPKDKRLRTSIMIEVERTATPALKGESTGHPLGRGVSGMLRFIIDTGPDFRQQMLRERVEGIDAVIYTHDHRDHVAGLDDIRAFNFIQKKRIDLYATEAVQQGIKEQFSYIFKNSTYPGLPEVDFHSIENKPFSIKGVTFTPVLVKHMHLDVFGFRIGNFTYITDANSISAEEKKKIIGSEVLVLNALRHDTHPSHFTLQEAIDLAIELKAKKTYLIHMSHQIGLHEEVEDTLPENIHLAFDGLKLEAPLLLSPRGRV